MSAQQTALRLLADALSLTPETVPGDARLGTVEQWDSLAHTRLLMAIEEKLGRMLTPDEAVAIESVDDIARLF